MSIPSPTTEKVNMGLERDKFESPRDLRDWLSVERKLVRVTSQRRIKEASDLVAAYETGKLTSRQAKKQFAAYAIRWPNRLCLDESTEIEIEAEVTGFEPNPTGKTPYRPIRRARVRNGVHN